MAGIVKGGSARRFPDGESLGIVAGSAVLSCANAGAENGNISIAIYTSFPSGNLIVTITITTVLDGGTMHLPNSTMAMAAQKQHPALLEEKAQHTTAA